MPTETAAGAVRTHGRIRLRSGQWLWSLVPQGPGRAAVLHLAHENTAGDELHLQLDRRVEGLTDGEVAQVARFASERMWTGPGGRQWKITEVSLFFPRVLQFECGPLKLRVREPDELRGYRDIGLGDLTTAEIAHLLGTAVMDAAADGAPSLQTAALPWAGRRTEPEDAGAWA